MKGFNFNKMLPLFFGICLLVYLPAGLKAQDSSHLRVSLLTCTPGEELYSIFGHSAIRIIDSSRINPSAPIEDLVYNYGTFNFDDEGFYLKFIRGKLLYYISLAEFSDFKAEYQEANRGITEQLLNLTAAEKINIQRQLNENLKEENKYYKYDFFLDNCTTRLRDIILASKHPTPELPAVMPVKTTFRNAIHIYLDKGRQDWSKLGIDILLGAPTDAEMTSAQQQFLPDNLMIALDSSRNVKIVQSSKNLYPVTQPGNLLKWFTPKIFFSLLLLFFITSGLFNKKVIGKIISGLDGLLFFTTGLLGFLLIFMMLGTDHSMTKMNYNILWAWPTHLFIAFFINSQHKFVRFYLLFVAVGMTILLVSWLFLPQLMNNALLPLVILFIYRSWSKYFKL